MVWRGANRGAGWVGEERRESILGERAVVLRSSNRERSRLRTVEPVVEE